MIAYFDCFSGVAGDMVLGAMLDAGLPFEHLKKELGRLPIKNYRLIKRIEHRGVVGGTNLCVEMTHHVCHPEEAKPTKDPLHTISDYKTISRMLKTSRLSKNVREMARAIFETLASAEARVHRTSIDHVHFHEVGAIDSIVDIVGCAIGLNYFGFSAIYSSPLPITRGFVKCAHGRIPVPAPATLEILKGVPLAPAPVKDEIVTPTGAAILKTIVKGFGENPLRRVDKIGYGHGDKHFKGIPNALRLMIGIGEPLIAIEANIDDANPQMYDFLIEKLMASGAIDVVVRPVYMKKRRPSAQVQVLCDGAIKKRLIDTILRETPTFGVRYYTVDRAILDREIKPVKTKFGIVRMKLGFLDGDEIKVVPEYEDCKRLAIRHGVPLAEVYRTLVR